LSAFNWTNIGLNSVILCPNLLAIS
jgi:hypothetical protein